jgi:hypothetical protein
MCIDEGLDSAQIVLLLHAAVATSAWCHHQQSRHASVYKPCPPSKPHHRQLGVPRSDRAHTRRGSTATCNTTTYELCPAALGEEECGKVGG